MFTGIVAAMGRLSGRQSRAPGAKLTVSCALPDGPPVLGESIAVDGVCLTVAAVLRDGFESDASAETLARSTLGRLAVGAPVNLERALRAGSPIGGHLVAGHVDGTGELVAKEGRGEAVVMTLAAPAELMRFVAEKGSVAVAGVSLTVNATAGDRFEVMVVPHTLRATTLGALAAGDPVNLEVDLLARYVARWIATER